MNDGSGYFGLPTLKMQSARNDAPAQDVELADLNGDGYLDIIASDWRANTNGLSIPTIFLQKVTIIEIDIDIKPGSYPNAVNINGSGVER